MLLEVKHLYDFGEFRFDTKEKILIRDKEHFALTPKVFELLSVFVENQGRLIEKDELMKKLWADSFVEDSNLTFTIRQLRKILGDDAQNPTYIKTVPRHGYRFIAPVNEIFEEETSVFEDNLPVEIFPLKAVEPTDAALKNTYFRQVFFKLSVPIAVLSIFLVASIAVASWVWRINLLKSDLTAPILTADFKSEKLTNTGGVFQAVISPDGKRMAYSSEINDKQSIWIRQFETSENIQILPNSDEFYYGLGFSHDGQTIYFARGIQSGIITIYHVSVFGGIPKEIVNGTQGWFSLSPDDKQISFVRCAEKDDDNCSLYIADTDGKNERKILTRPRPIRLGDNQFSPDGKSIAFAVGQSSNASNEFNLREINIETGVESEITGQKFFYISNLRWLSNKSGFIITATELYQRPTKIYRVSRQTGEVKTLTKDSTYYNQISLDNDADKMVATQYFGDFRLWLAPASDMNAAKIVSFAQSGFVYTPSGKLIYGSTTDGNQNIWMMNGDGTEQRQLTNGQGANSQPRVSPDEKFIYFASNRSGSSQIWRMNADGSNQTQISNDEGGDPLFVTADGNTVYYKTSLSRNLKKVTLNNDGNLVSSLISNERMYGAAINPTGETAAYFSHENDGSHKIVLMSAADGKILQSFIPADEKSRPMKILWSKDSKYLYYLVRNGSKSVIWQLSLETGKSEILDEMNDHELTDFAFSPDGKTFAFICGRWRHDAFLIEGLK
jgi:Tol biopolymer transport system component/DNA-binding winged helix-turn-helix (wHTH) protein